MGSNGGGAIVSVIVNRVFHNNVVSHWSGERELVSAQSTAHNSTLCLDPVVNTTERFTLLCTSHATGAAFHYHENTRYFAKAISGAFCTY